MKTKTISAIVTVFALVLFSVAVFGVPQGPTGVVRGASERSDTGQGTRSQQADAGNTTSLGINATKITARWQGYYGNVTGTIVLDDALNNSLYTWRLANPSGEIYASNGSGVTWAKIDCINYTAITNGSSRGGASTVFKYNLTLVNEFIGLSRAGTQADEDSVNGTFNLTYGSEGTGTAGETFTVGDTTINNAANCSMVNLYNKSGWQEVSFNEVLLTDNESIIFAALLESDVRGFQTSPVDFEMLVGVNGTVSGTTRTYYFYVELT